MKSAGWERWVPLSGIVFVLLTIPTLFLPAKAPPSAGDPAAKWAAFVQDHRSAYLVSMCLSAARGRRLPGLPCLTDDPASRGRPGIARRGRPRRRTGHRRRVVRVALLRGCPSVDVAQRPRPHSGQDAARGGRLRVPLPDRRAGGRDIDRSVAVGDLADMALIRRARGRGLGPWSAEWLWQETDSLHRPVVLVLPAGGSSSSGCLSRACSSCGGRNKDARSACRDGGEAGEWNRRCRSSVRRHPEDWRTELQAGCCGRISR